MTEKPVNLAAELIEELYSANLHVRGGEIFSVARDTPTNPFLDANAIVKGEGSGGQIGVMGLSPGQPASSGGRSIALNKNKNKNKNKNASGVVATGQVAFGLSPQRELKRLHAAWNRPVPDSGFFEWQHIELPFPPGPDATATEAGDLMLLQRRRLERFLRRDEIERQDTMDMSDFTRALNVENAGGYQATESLFQTILLICEYVGLQYKDMFGRTRPNLVEPRLRPMLAVPPHLSYPSNHAFQCMSAALVFERYFPHHPATAELHRIARRIGYNREWAGLHYRSDTDAGFLLAERFLPFLVDACKDLILEAQSEWI